MRVPFSKTTLRNGLDVIVHEDHRLPLAAVNVWYRVGSRNEEPGLTGLAHLFEHLMFEGSQHQPRSFFEPLQEAGGALNGSTNPDRTNYWEIVPRGALERALWMEADRMGYMLPALSDERFQTQRGVVLNERRQNYENRAYGLANFILSDAMLPESHPYHWPTIGYVADLERMTVDDARAFLTRFYHPANASLVVAGDVETDATYRLVEDLFGAIPAGPVTASVTAPAVSPNPVRLYFEDRVELPRLYMAWPSAPVYAPDDGALDLAADLLGNGKTSRLYRQLTHDERIASELGAAQTSRELGGTFQIVATASPGRTLDENYAAIVRSLSDLGEHGPDEDEMERGRAHAEASFVYRLEQLGGFGGRADQLNAYNVHIGEPDWFDRDLDRYLVVTRESLRDAAARWLDPAHAVVLSVVPNGRPDLALPGSEPAPKVG